MTGETKADPRVPDPAFAAYTVEDYDARVGRSSVIAVCECGARNLCYLWSWAGHGKRRCHGCGKWLRYLG